MSNLSEKTIGELCDACGGSVKTGPFGSQLHQSDYQETGIPFVMPADIINGKISERRVARVSESHASRLRVHKLRIGDIIYGRRGDIGRQALIRPFQEGWLCGSGCMRLRLPSSEVLPEYLHHYLSIPEIVGWIENQAIGATMPNLNSQILRRVPVRYPKSKITQRKVVAVLAAYDDLIENNKRRIAILEKMAEEIYREWFVRMRFPGHENTKFEKGVPEGWDVRAFEEVVSYYIGGGWGEEFQTASNSDGAYVIRGTDIPKLNSGKFQKEVFRFHKPSNLKSRRLEVHDFVFEVSGGSTNQLLGRNLHITEKIVEFFDGNVMSASFCKLIRFDRRVVSPYLIRYFLKLYYEYDLVGIFQVQSTGISNYQFESFLKYQTVILPPKELQDKFEIQIKPIISLKDHLSLCNVALSESRDLLLPRLISGKLSVENLDIQFPPSMMEGMSDEG